VPRRGGPASACRRSLAGMRRVARRVALLRRPKAATPARSGSRRGAARPAHRPLLLRHRHPARPRRAHRLRRGGAPGAPLTEHGLRARGRAPPLMAPLTLFPCKNNAISRVRMRTPAARSPSHSFPGGRRMRREGPRPSALRRSVTAAARRRGAAGISRVASDRGRPRRCRGPRPRRHRMPSSPSSRTARGISGNPSGTRPPKTQPPGAARRSRPS